MLTISLLAAAVTMRYCVVIDASIRVAESLSTLQSSLNTKDAIHAKLEIQAEQTLNDVASGARKKRQVFMDYTYLNSTWKNGIFYTFNTSDDLVQKVFKMGIKVWSESTCIDFVEDNNAQDKVVVVKQNGCWSSVGQIGGDQLLSLGESCTTQRSAVHEIGHVLELFHTMQRYDRDNYITIFGQNIQLHHFIDFGKVERIDADVYGLAYDYGSAMHYSEIGFSSNNQTTMIATDPRYHKTMGSQLISFSDLFMINEHHGCNAICNKSTSAKCANEGFPHPRNCSICMCPGGYGGDLCDQRPPGCGENLEATRRKKSMTYTLDVGPGLRDQFVLCNYMITAPEEMKIEMNPQAISRGYDLPGCPRGGVEVKAQMDHRLTGYRFCSVNGSSGLIFSTSYRLPVILFNKFGLIKIKFTYRSVL